MTHEQLLRIYWAAQPDGILNLKGEFGNYALLGYRRNPVSKQSEPIIEGSRYLMDWAINGGPEKLYKPHLKPLSSITDEDAIAVAKIAIGVNESSRLYSWTLKKRGVVLGSPSPSIAGEVFEFEIDETKWSLSVYLHGICHGERDVSNPWEITDYLRSKGYNLDFEEANYIKI